MTRSRWFSSLALVCIVAVVSIIFSATVTALAFQPASPIEVLNGITSTLKRLKETGEKSLYFEHASKLVASHVAINEVAAHVYGREFSDLPRERQDRFIRLVTKLLSAAITEELLKNIQELPPDSVEKIHQGRAKITFSLPFEDRDSRYAVEMREIAGRWIIFDINIDGVSMLRNMMYQVRSVRKSGGYEGVIDKLDQMIGEFDKEGVKE